MTPKRLFSRIIVKSVKSNGRNGRKSLVPMAERRVTSGTPDPADYPGIMAIAADAAARRPGAASCDEDAEFDFALEVILDGIARLRRTGWDSGRSTRGQRVPSRSSRN